MTVRPTAFREWCTHITMTWCILIPVVMLSGVIRFGVATDELMIDEVWSLEWVSMMSHWWDAFTIHHDNNHIVNTIYLFFFGTGTWWPLYRLHSVLMGTATVGVLTWFGLKRGLLEGALVALLTTISFPLILQSTQARGYAFAMACGVLAFFAFHNFYHKQRLLWVVVFWAACIVGILSHLTFLYILGGFVITSLYRAYSSICNTSASTMDFVPPTHLLVVPIIVTIFLLQSWSDITIGGGPPVPSFTYRIFMLVSYVSIPYDVVGAMLGVYASVVVAYWIWKREMIFSNSTVFFMTTFFAVPIFAVFAPIPIFDPRYFALSLPLFLLILSFYLADSLRSRTAVAPVLAVLFLTIFTYGNVAMLFKHAESGRGQYSHAVSYIAEFTQRPTIQISSDHDFRNPLLIRFYAHMLGIEKDLYYIPTSEIALDTYTPEWFMLHTDSVSGNPPRILSFLDKKYELRGAFRHSNPLTGLSCFVYHIRYPGFS